VPIQLAQCWLPGLAISNAKIQIGYIFSNKMHGSNFITAHGNCYGLDEIAKMLIAV